MVVINKILNFLIFILAVAACYVSINLNNRRVQLKDRADSMQKTVIATAEILKGQADENTATNLTLSSLTDEKLNWKAYLTAGSIEAYSSSLNELTKASRQIIDQKVNMAAHFSEIAETLNLEHNADLQNLNDVITYSDNIKAITNKVGGVTSRAKLIAKELETISKTLGSKQPSKNLNALNDVDEELKGNLDAINNAAAKLYTKNSELAKGYKKLATALGNIEDERLKKMVKLTFNTEDFNGDRKDISRAVNIFASDLKKTKNSIEEYLSQLNDDQGNADRILLLKETLSEIEKENDELKLAYGKAAKKNEMLKAELVLIQNNLQDISNTDLPKNLVAKVSQVNDKFDFVVLNKGSYDQVRVGGILLIHDGNKFICKVKVTKVHKNSSVCDILPVTRPKNSQGEYIMPAIGNEAVVPTI